MPVFINFDEELEIMQRLGIPLQLFIHFFLIKVYAK